MIKKKQLVFVFVLVILFLSACTNEEISTEVKTEDVTVGVSSYVEYIEAFRKLVQNEIEFEKPQTGDRFYLKDYGFMKESEDELFDPNQYKYALYDMDEDGTPELCMWDWHTYIFKYDTVSKEIILCEEIKSYRESERFAQKMEEISYNYGSLFTDVEWSLHDLNGDGIEDLVRKGKEDSVKPIREIFDGKNGQRVFLDEIDMGEYYFVTDNGDLAYHWDYNGIYWFESYEKYVYDMDWNIELESGVYAWCVADVDEMGWFDGHDHTNMIQNGTYFTAYSNGEEKRITKEEYIKTFESITGLDFEYLEEDLFWLKEDKEDKLYSWTGIYKYTETFPHTLDEDANYFIAYEICIYEENGKYLAKVSSNGWQIESKSLAYVTGDETSIDLVFMETTPDDSLYGTCERYEKDDVLLSLAWQDGTLETKWKKLRNEHPVFIEIEDEIVGEYFFKVK